MINLYPSLRQWEASIYCHRVADDSYNTVLTIILCFWVHNLFFGF